MIWQILELALYTAAAVGTLVRSWRRDTRVLGFVLVGFCLVCAVEYFYAPFGLVVISEIMFALLMAIISAVLCVEGESARQHLTVIGLCAIDTAFCGLICWRGDAGVGAQTLFSHGADALFVGMCAAIAFPGAVDAIWDRVRFGRRVRDRNRSAVAAEDTSC